jgi:asparagine synthase (glutamine-hydrolysing)
LRRAVEDLLPRSIVWRRKRGFDPPMDRWLRGPLAPLLADALSSLGGRPMFRRTAIEALAARWRAGHESSHFVYALVVLELWLRGLR